MRISDWSSDVCSSDLDAGDEVGRTRTRGGETDPRFACHPAVGVGGERRRLLVADQDMRQAGSRQRVIYWHDRAAGIAEDVPYTLALQRLHDEARPADGLADTERLSVRGRRHRQAAFASGLDCSHAMRSEEHTSELQSLMRISYAVFFLNKH